MKSSKENARVLTGIICDTCEVNNPLLQDSVELPQMVHQPDRNDVTDDIAKQYVEGKHVIAQSVETKNDDSPSVIRSQTNQFKTKRLRDLVLETLWKH